MIPDLINYKISFLNPALKLLVPAIFLIGAYYFFRMRNQYQGEIGVVIKRLALVGLVGFLANFFRYGADIWFASWKWGESLGFLAFALANVYAVWPLLAFIQEIKIKK
jgi:hypothetical protein